MKKLRHATDFVPCSHKCENYLKDSPDLNLLNVRIFYKCETFSKDIRKIRIGESFVQIYICSKMFKRFANANLSNV